MYQLEETNAELEKTVKALRNELAGLRHGVPTRSASEAALGELAQLRAKNEEKDLELARLRDELRLQGRKQEEFKAEKEWLTRELQAAKASLKEETEKRAAIERARDGFMSAYTAFSTAGTRGVETGGNDPFGRGAQ